jgi:hypothetical protein
MEMTGQLQNMTLPTGQDAWYPLKRLGKPLCWEMNTDSLVIQPIGQLLHWAHDTLRKHLNIVRIKSQVILAIGNREVFSLCKN